MPLARVIRPTKYPFLTTQIYTHVLNRGPSGVQSPAGRMLGG